MKVKKLLVFLLVLTTVVAMFCGCGKKKAKESEPAPEAAGKKITVTVIHADGTSKDFEYETNAENVDICPTNINLAGAEVELVTVISREQILKNAIKPVLDSYDFIILDSPPSLGLLTINALTAADRLVIPIQGEYYALEGLSQLMDTINIVKKKLNPDLEILGVVLTMFNMRTQLSRQVKEETDKYFGTKVFKTVIPRNVRLAEAPSHGLAICDYDKNSKGAKAYEALVKEVIKRV